MYILQAIEIYEEVGTSALDSQLLKYSAKDYFFKAALCHLCVDLLNGQQAIQKYKEMHPALNDSRECKLLVNLMLHMEENDVDGFTEVVKEFDSISRLDQWHTTMLLRVKKTIEGEDDMK